jgi:crotonobetainyl-CoA:carnitine CoA-transferase CaiB-like acyl-CoA transferase
VLVETYTPRVMRHFGMDYPRLREIKEDLIMIPMSGYGQNGAWSNFGALGYGLEAASGIAWLNGYPGGSPIRSCILFNNPLSGLVGAGALLTALLHLRRTGEGQYIDLSEHEAALPLIGEAILDFAMNDRLPERLGNGRRGIAPHGCYRCRGRDHWLAVACSTEEEWRALCRATGHVEWADDPRFIDTAARYEHREALDRLIAGWTADRDHLEAMHQLQAAGVPATAVLNGMEVMLDPRLRARGYFEMIEHPGVGRRPFPRYLGSRFGAFATSSRTRAPRLGEHNYEILAHLGLSEAEVRRLEADRVRGTQPEVTGSAQGRRLSQSRQWPLEQLREQGALLDIEPDYRQAFGA